MDSEEARSGISPETWRVIGLAVCLVLVSVLFGQGVLWSAPPRLQNVSLPWWSIAIFFAVTESAVLHIQVKREAQTVSISELPLVIGLFFASPWSLLLGRLVGSVLVFVLHRRSSGLKTTFNTALVAAETCVALAVFDAFAGEFTVAAPGQWFAALAAALVANAVGFLAIGLVIANYEGSVTVGSLFGEALVGQLFAPGVVVLALMAVSGLSHGTQSGWLVALSAVVLTACYRMYATLFDRHVNLERLYGFSQAVADSSDTGFVLRQVLHEAKEMMRSKTSQLVFPAARPAAGLVRVTLDKDGNPQREFSPRSDSSSWLHQAVLDDGDAVVLPRRARDPRTRAWLADNQLRDALAVPLRGGTGVLGMLLVGERLGEVRSFEREDVLLLETLANHASVALEKGQLIEQLQHDALHDALTGLPNRSHLQRELARLLEDADDGSAGVAVMILDLDGFKDVNDTLGHHQGDRVLVEVAQRLLGAVGGDGFVARLGGDEFAVLVPDSREGDAPRRLGERIVSCLRTPIRLQGIEVGVGGSVGIALSPQHGSVGSVLMKRADMAMYDAKASMERICFYKPAKDTTSARRLAMVNEMRSALEAGLFEVHVQPQAEASSGRVRTVEALARWSHPSMGSVSPQEFIPLAERSGLVGPLTLAVLEASLAAASQWRHMGVSVAVNLSPRSLLDPTLVPAVSDALRRWDVPPASLVLEITEGAVMTDPDSAVSVLRRLRELGVRLSVDDFGTGYSSLSYLRRLPVHEVKIDRSFVKGMVSSKEDLAIVRSILTLTADLGLETVAEGVEDQRTFDLLSTMGCTRLQGWHIARPMPIAAASDWLAARARPAQADQEHSPSLVHI